MKSIFDFLTGNQTLVTLLVSIIVGLATIVTSIANIVVAKQQNKISDYQNKMQNLMNQPLFKIKTSNMQDGDDNIYRTEILDITNNGRQIRSYNVNTNVFFCLSKFVNGRKQSIYVMIDDYFYASTRNSSVDNNIKHSFCPGNERIFYNGYLQAIEDSKGSNTVYLYDKIILNRIDYVDIFGEKHTVFFDDNNEIDELTYKTYFDYFNKDFNGQRFSLSTIDYNNIKQMIDKLYPSLVQQATIEETY